MTGFSFFIFFESPRFGSEAHIRANEIIAEINTLFQSYEKILNRLRRGEIKKSKRADQLADELLTLKSYAVELILKK